MSLESNGEGPREVIGTYTCSLWKVLSGGSEVRKSNWKPLGR